MMKHLGELRTVATHAAEFRGHLLIWTAPHHGEARSYQNAHCALCHRSVTINTKPMANESDIGGEAVALYCTGISDTN